MRSSAEVPILAQRKGTCILSLLCLFLALTAVPVAGAASAAPSGPAAPDMPDRSHELLAAHAAQSHGWVDPQVAWIAQGAYDEDHCAFEPYPPCVPWIPSGWHSWDPDTGQYWTEPAGWPDFGSGLAHADWLFGRAVEAHAAGNEEAAYLLLGRAVHLVGDMATPAHVHLDTHLPPLDMDPYELWLNEDDLANTRAWLDAHPPGPEWDLSFRRLPGWADLGSDLQGQLDAASGVYGGRGSGQELWELGPAGLDATLFRLLYLMAEQADNWDSGDVSGEQTPGDLSDPAYLAAMRDTLFPLIVPYGAALLDYFESRIPPCPGCRAFLPLVQRGTASERIRELIVRRSSSSNNTMCSPAWHQWVESVLTYNTRQEFSHGINLEQVARGD